MRSMLCKSGLVALIAGLALGASTASAGTAVFTLTDGELTGTTGTAHFSSVVLDGFGALDQTFNQPNNNLGKIVLDLSGSPVPITVDASNPNLTFNGTMNPMVTGSTSGYGSYTFLPPGSPNTFDASVLSQFNSYSYSDITYSGNLITGGTFTLSTAAVPEPSAFAMGAIALVGMIAARRRFAKSAA